MAGARRQVLARVVAGLCLRFGRTRPLEDDPMDTQLDRCLSTLDITLLGIGHMAGAGIYVLTGTVARDLAGAATTLSFLLAGLASLLAALCYAEFGTRVPRAGSAYLYTYVSVGELWAFVIGWNIILEHMIGTASVARAWSGYLDSVVGGAVSNATVAITGELHEQLLGRYPDVLAFLICIAFCLLLAIGVKTSAYINNALTVLNIAVIITIIGVGFCYADFDNWSEKQGGFMPYGFSGVLAGAATCFYAYVGFDSISSSSEEAKDPTYSIPLATIISMTAVGICYILVSAALTLMIPYYKISSEAAIPEAFGTLGISWAKYAVAFGALCGMTTSLLGSLFTLPRCLYAMAQDGLIFSFLGGVNSKNQIPLVNLLVSGLSSATIALLFDLETLVEFMSIGTLLAYTIVSAAVIILRYRPATAAELRALGLGGMDLSPDSSPTGSPVTDPGSISSEMYEVMMAGRLRTGYSWLRPVLGGRSPGSAVTASVTIYSLLAAALCAHTRLSGTPDSFSALLLPFALFALMALCLVVIWAHQQSPVRPPFRCPLVPFFPAASILFNVELMIHLNALTWVRFAVWMAFGLVVYLGYGMRHSRAGTGAGAGSGGEGGLLVGAAGTHALWGSTSAQDTTPIVQSEGE